MSTGGRGARPVSVVCVCTGNVCRSPATEQLLAEALGPAAVVESVGTRALVGEPVAPPMRRLLGPDPRGPGFRARQLRAPVIASADLVLTMADEHTGAVVEEVPQAVRRTFRLKELAWLLRGVPPQSLGSGDLVDRVQAGLVTAAARRRPVPDSSVHDVVDPYGRAESDYLAAFDDIRSAVVALAGLFLPTPYTSTR